MSAQCQLDLERAELHSVVNSETFAKSPNLAKMLQYIGQKYLDGQDALIKEYNIGVEALGRSPDFDPKEDSIVRVEAHRLREKLRRFYEAEGKDHPLIITLQVGHYAPQFARRVAPPGNGADSVLAGPAHDVSNRSENGETSVNGAVAHLPQTAVLPAATPKRIWRDRRWGLIAGAAVLFLVIGVVLLGLSVKSRSRAANASTTAESSGSPNPAIAQGDSVRIIAGYSKSEYVDRMGNPWGADRYFTGGDVLAGTSVFIARAADSTLFETARQGEFAYDIPIKPGPHQLTLYFVETAYGPGTLRGGGETSRLFHVDLNGKRLLTDFDVINDAGGNNIADERVYKDVYAAPDGELHLRFTKAIDYPVLSALEVLPSTPGKMLPIRVVAQENSYTDQAGRLWILDRYFSGGRLIANTRPVSGTQDSGLYAGERYGHFDYALPVAEGEYAVTLHFAETYFGPNNPGKGGVGSRAFDVYCNGSALLRNFDIYKEAGGDNRALAKTFHGLRPNSSGKLLISFVPVTNYASVKAIEVVDESK